MISQSTIYANIRFVIDEKNSDYFLSVYTEPRCLHICRKFEKKSNPHFLVLFLFPLISLRQKGDRGGGIAMYIILYLESTII